ncbi:MAG: ATP-binding cassette domain-containing protein [Pseudomonadota bacterium]
MALTKDSFDNIVQLLEPLPLPDEHKEKIFVFSTRSQLGIALMLNILSLALPIMMLQVYDRIIPHQSYGTLVMLTLGVISALVLDAALRIIRSYMTGWSTATNEHAASCAAIDRAIESDVTRYEHISSGEHMQNFSALGRLREFYSGQAMTALIDLPFIFIFLGLITYLGGMLVLAPIALLILFYVCARIAGNHLRTTLAARAVVDDRKASFIVSVLHGIHTTKAVAIETPLVRRFEALQNDVSEQSYRVALASSAATTLSAIFGQLSLVITASFGCLMVIQGNLSMGGLSACTLLAGRAIQPIQRVLGTWLRLQDLTVARDQADHLFTLPIQKRSTETLPHVNGNITLEDVNFAYETGAPILKSISLSLDAGEAIAITGSKGSGKSTLLQLLTGLLTPQSGTIRLDTVDPGQYSLGALRHVIGYMPQQGAIFKGSILENLTGFRTDDDSVMRVLDAVRELGLDPVIDQLPHGYHTLLTDTASDPIPPGIKQRIALARVMAREPAIMLFDDADRALDKDGYNLLFRLIGRLKGRSTLILVSQDQNLMSFADRVYDLRDGELQLENLNQSQTLSRLVQMK